SWFAISVEWPAAICTRSGSIVSAGSPAVARAPFTRSRRAAASEAGSACAAPAVANALAAIAIEMRMVSTQRCIEALPFPCSTHPSATIRGGGSLCVSEGSGRQLTRLAVLGGGNMGEALIDGLIAAKWAEPADLVVAETR